MFSNIFGSAKALAFLPVSLEYLALDLKISVLVKMLYILSVEIINCPSLKFVFDMSRNFIGLLQWRFTQADDTCPETEAQVCRVCNSNWTLRAARLITQISEHFFSLRRLCVGGNSDLTQMGNYKHFK